MTIDHMPEAPPFEGLRASRYFAGWSEKVPDRYARQLGALWPRHGFDLFASDPRTDRPRWSPPVVHLPDHDPRWYRSIPIPALPGEESDPPAWVFGELGRAPHFGRDHHEAEAWVDGRPVPLARFSLESAAQNVRQPGFSYRLGGPTGRPLARIESQRSLNIENGVDVWRCTTASGSSVVARYRPPERPEKTPTATALATLALEMLKLTPTVIWQFSPWSRRSKIERLDLHDRWVDGAVPDPEGGWELLDAWDRPVLWMLPPGVGHLTAWALVGPDGASLEHLDPAVILFACFILYACDRPTGRPGDQRDWVI
jgi:hypothetical protein